MHPDQIAFLTHQTSHVRALCLSMSGKVLLQLITLLLCGSVLACAVAAETDPSHLPRSTTQPPVSQATDKLFENHQNDLLEALYNTPDVRIYPILVGSSAPHYPQQKNYISATLVAQANVLEGLTVLYPELREPFRSVFIQIMEGIESQAQQPVNNIKVASHDDMQQLNQTLKNSNTRVVIALGRQGLDIANNLDKDINVIVGGILTHAPRMERPLTINTLTPDPALLFAQLLKFKPNIKTIYTVYNPKHNQWLVDLAQKAAQQQGVRLISYKADNIRLAVRVYKQIFAKANTPGNALWLPQDPTTVDATTILPMILRASWSGQISVFSSSFSHVKRGVLFSLYPDNTELGRQLAGSALSYLSGNKSGGQNILPLREVLMAINLRTARHLGVDESLIHDFDIAFPEK